MKHQNKLIFQIYQFYKSIYIYINN